MSNVKFKNPNAPASEKQLAFYNVLATERGLPAIATFAEGTTVKDASEAIDALKNLPKAATPSLLEMAAQIEGGTPAIPQAPTKPFPAMPEEDDDLEATAPIMLAFNREECEALKGALSVTICETDGSEMDHVLAAKIDAFLKGAQQPATVTMPHYIGGGTVEVASAGTVIGGKPGAKVPAGHYALKAADGTFDFYKVDHGKPGTQWDGFVFLSKQAGDDFIPVKPNHGKGGILNKIAANPLEAAKAYGHELGVCGICHKTLTDPESIANGIGPVCASKF